MKLWMTNATPLHQQVGMFSQGAPLATVVLGSCSAVKGRLRLWNAKETEKTGDTSCQSLTYLFVPSFFFLLTCVSSYSRVSQVFIFPTEKQSHCLNSVTLATFPPIQHNAILALYWLMFSVNNLQENKISADKICRCCRVQGVVNNDQNRTLSWVFSKAENMQTLC